MSTNENEFCRNAIAYLKVPATDDAPIDIEFTEDDSPVITVLNNVLLCSYLVDTGNSYTYVQNRHLVASGMSQEDLHQISLKNLAAIIDERLEVKKYNGIYMAFVGGDFEASLLMLDDLWDDKFFELVNGSYAAVIPARDILAFCDSSNEEQLEQLLKVVEEVASNGDHLLTQKVFIRNNGQWLLNKS